MVEAAVKVAVDAVVGAVTDRVRGPAARVCAPTVITASLIRSVSRVIVRRVQNAVPR